jgi:hypothetical protein
MRAYFFSEKPKEKRIFEELGLDIKIILTIRASECDSIKAVHDISVSLSCENVMRIRYPERGDDHLDN